MMNSELYPYLFTPVYKDYLWGGERIPQLFRRSETPHPCAESWEVSSHPDGMSVVENGAAAGQTLAALCATHGKALLGRHVEGDTFPLLVKLIDAKQRLSVQVHPNENNAKLCGGDPKTEMWYFLDAREGGIVCAGLKKGIGPRIFRDAVREKAVPTLLTAVDVEPGKAIYIPGGLVHAICEGNLVLEVQQNSNTTYRVYDWDRVGADGKARELHLDKAEKAIEWKLGTAELLTPYSMGKLGTNNLRERVLRSDFFCMERWTLEESEPGFADGSSFRIVFPVKGALRIQEEGRVTEVPFGRSCLLPATLGAYTLEPVDRTCVFLSIEV